MATTSSVWIWVNSLTQEGGNGYYKQCVDMGECY